VKHHQKIILEKQKRKWKPLPESKTFLKGRDLSIMSKMLNLIKRARSTRRLPKILNKAK